MGSHWNGGLVSCGMDRCFSIESCTWVNVIKSFKLRKHSICEELSRKFLFKKHVSSENLAIVILWWFIVWISALALGQCVIDKTVRWLWAQLDPKNWKSFRQNLWLHAREDPSHQPCTCMKKLHKRNNIINLNMGRLLVIITPTLKEWVGFWRLSVRSVGGFLCIFFKSKRDLKE